MTVAISHAALQEAIRNMGSAQKEMEEGLAWMQNNFNALRETLTGETRLSWESFEAELGKLKLQLADEYRTAQTTLQRMHARQIQGDSSGSEAVKKTQLS
ncbi:hypothetical protein OH828_04475 [Streptomyces anulatus]|uniref:hypothetical protein n=1 Tax=Streptomyces TaxID=1883 RepID=UPI000BF0CBE4|nr:MULTISPECIES: hypothetical protein [Streptomyces]UPT46020.1 hypothetical protein MWG59_34345 [Streptomyces sp. WAC00303]WIY80145.1 hypothetical protein QPM16_34010 [Streptomyces anulatus]WTF60264.1 hypothetical protein OH791_04095 [Streptomyces anulatus]